MRLLIVEDNKELAELLAKGLQNAGYEADVLSTVEEATRVLSTTFYAALILDLLLGNHASLAAHQQLQHLGFAGRQQLRFVVDRCLPVDGVEFEVCDAQ